jgi:two-component system nitrogen regulation sensor histidine kinase NtrY
LDLREAVRDPLTLFQMGTSDIDFELKMPQQPILMSVDRRLISQAVTNLVKNAAEAIQQAAESADGDPGYRGRIETSVMATGERATIEVVDNGVGLAKHNRLRLLEPYVTTKAKGTGLGLAIVQKIVEQHHGVLTLEDAPRAPERNRGTLVRIALPMRTREATPGPQENSVAAE